MLTLDQIMAIVSDSEVAEMKQAAVYFSLLVLVACPVLVYGLRKLFKAGLAMVALFGCFLFAMANKPPVVAPQVTWDSGLYDAGSSFDTNSWKTIHFRWSHSATIAATEPVYFAAKHKDHPERWVEHSVVNQAKSLRNGELEIMSVVGTGDFFLEVNRELHQVLTTNKIAHTYVEIRGEDDAESEHTWETFHRAEKMILAFFCEYFDRETVRLSNPTGEVVADVGEGDRVEIALDEPKGFEWKASFDELSTHVIVTRESAANKVRVVIRPFCTGPAAVKLFKVKAGASFDGQEPAATIRIP